MNIYFLILLWPLFSFANYFSPREIVEFSVEHTPEIKTQLFSLKASKSQLQQTKLIGNPILTFQGGTLKSGSQAGGVTDITLGQPFPWPGKRQARIDSQEFLIKLGELDYEETKLEIAHRANLLALEIAAIQEMEKHYTERRRRFSLIEISLRSRPQASPKQQVERDLIISQLNIMGKEMFDLMARKEGLLWEVNLLSGKEIKGIKYSWEKLSPALSKNNYIDLLEAGPRPRRWRLQKNISENKIEQARLEARPDIVLGVNYRTENVSPVNHFYHGQVSVVIPIIDRGQYSAEVARVELRRTEAVSSMERNQYLSLLHQSFAELEASRKTVEIFPLKYLHQMEKKFDNAEVAFRKGQIDALTFLQVDAQIHENIDQIYFSRLAYMSALSKLNSLVGKGPQL